MKNSESQVKNSVMSAMKSTPITSDNDKSFIERAYGDGNLNKYRARIQAIGFVNKRRVLDAGCGFGQWSIALSEMNNEVIATDIDPSRIEVAKKISCGLGAKNISWKTEAMDGHSLESDSFDAIFSYNAIALSPYRQTLGTFHRSLRSGGYLYFNAYDIGWMIHNILESHNPASDFDPRLWAIDSINNTLNYIGGFDFAQRNPRDSLFIPKEIIKKELIAMGFDLLSVCGDGMTSTYGNYGQEPFFIGEKYGLAAVYEVLCRKI